MPKLETVPASTPTAQLMEIMARDGALILSDVIGESVIEAMTAEVAPFIERTPMGSDEFTGRATQRTGALAARTPTCRNLIVQPEILAAARAYLAPFTERILLHLTQTIFIHPGQGAQVLHRDRLAWGRHIPRSIEPQCNTIWALTEFTAANGATRVVPGSHLWDDDQLAAPEQICQAEMAPGSVLLYSGSVLHSGGENRSNTSRLGLNITYCLGWLRTEENQYLSCPPHIARTLDPELQELLGYTQGNYALGYYSDPAFNPAEDDSVSDILPPEHALGRMPRPGMGMSLSDATGEGVDAAMVENGQV